MPLADNVAVEMIEPAGSDEEETKGKVRMASEEEAMLQWQWCEAMKGLVANAGLLALRADLTENIPRNASAEVQAAAAAAEPVAMPETMPEFAGLLVAIERDCTAKGLDLIDLVRLFSAYLDHPWILPHALQLRRDVLNMEQQAWIAVATKFNRSCARDMKRYVDLEQEDTDAEHDE